MQEPKKILLAQPYHKNFTGQKTAAGYGKRIFICTFIKSDFLLPVYDKLKEDFGYQFTGKWVEPENFHITFKFYVHLNHDELSDLRRGMRNICKTYENTLMLQGISAFPAERAPKSIHINVLSPDGKLNKLFTEIESASRRSGFQPEDNVFAPHITLLRVGKFNLNSNKPNPFKKYKDHLFIKIKEFKVSIVESQLTKNGPVYTELPF